MKFRSCERACQCRIRVPIYDNCIRLFLLENRLNGLEHGSGLRTMRSTSDAEMIIRHRDAEIFKEYIRHTMIIVLTSMDQDFLVLPANFKTQRASLDKLRSRTDHRKNFHWADTEACEGFRPFAYRNHPKLSSKGLRNALGMIPPITGTM